MKTAIILTLLVTSFSLQSYAGENRGTIMDLKENISEVAGNLFGPRGFFGTGVEFKTGLVPDGREFKNVDLTKIDEPIYYINKHCVMHSSGSYSLSEQLPEIEEGNIYGV